MTTRILKQNTATGRFTNFRHEMSDAGDLEAVVEDIVNKLLVGELNWAYHIFRSYPSSNRHDVTLNIVRSLKSLDRYESGVTLYDAICEAVKITSYNDNGDPTYSSMTPPAQVVRNRTTGLIQSLWYKRLQSPAYRDRFDVMVRNAKLERAVSADRNLSALQAVKDEQAEATYNSLRLYYDPNLSIHVLTVTGKKAAEVGSASSFSFNAGDYSQEVGYLDTYSYRDALEVLGARAGSFILNADHQRAAGLFKEGGSFNALFALSVEGEINYCLRVTTHANGLSAIKFYIADPSASLFIQDIAVPETEVDKITRQRHNWRTTQVRTGLCSKITDKSISYGVDSSEWVIGL